MRNVALIVRKWWCKNTKQETKKRGPEVRAFALKDQATLTARFDSTSRM